MAQAHPDGNVPDANGPVEYDPVSQRYVSTYAHRYDADTNTNIQSRFNSQTGRYEPEENFYNSESPSGYSSDNETAGQSAGQEGQSGYEGQNDPRGPQGNSAQDDGGDSPHDSDERF